MEKRSCPYCKKRLNKILKKKTKCEFCNKDIFVRTIPPNEKNLIKSNEVEKIEKLWIIYMTKSFWFRELIKLGTSEKSATDMYHILKERFGVSPLIADVMWGVFNNSLLMAIKEGNRNKQEIIKELMNKFKDAEKSRSKLWDF
jgi:hypothetical protein